MNEIRPGQLWCYKLVEGGHVTTVVLRPVSDDRGGWECLTVWPDRPGTVEVWRLESSAWRLLTDADA